MNQLARALVRSRRPSTAERNERLVAGGRILLTDKQAETIDHLAEEAASGVSNRKAKAAIYRATKALLETQVIGIDPPGAGQAH